MDPLPPELAQAPFTVRDALARGVRPDRLRRRDLRADFHGVRIAATTPDDLESRCRSFAARMIPGQFFSHLTAARIHGMRLPPRVHGAALEVSAVLPVRAPRVRGVVGHHVRAGAVPKVVSHRGLLVPTPAETWRSLAALLSHDELIAVGDGLVCRRRPLADMGQLADAVARHEGHRGSRRLRAALSEVRPGTDSERETWLRLVLTRAGLPEPEVNGRIGAPEGRERFGDLVFREWRVVAEYEGTHHQGSRIAYLSDIDRFEGLGREWRIIRIAKEHTASDALRRVTRALREAGWE